MEIRETTLNLSNDVGTPSEKWVFLDNLPIECTFMGESDVLNKAQKLIPVYVFAAEETAYILSKWNKPLVPLPVSSGDKVKLYEDAESKGKITVLKLN